MSKRDVSYVFTEHVLPVEELPYSVRAVCTGVECSNDPHALEQLERFTEAQVGIIPSRR